ncbi:MAG TPA: SpaA isopeptide-forming pilin-related protein [Jiangellaceae bacterium]|nr:SpaA isopeptide-forming pilin-related protein [Jiangellaceae bacterium]
MVGLVAAATAASPALANHPEASLLGSNFEIDENANLKLDDPAPSVDWGSLAHPNGPELRATDTATGRDDDSYSGGVKEDTECPGETTGSIPNNKSDLLTFHVYEEPGTGGHPGFLNLAWSRVSDPSGTTLMDFEFNQSETSCAAGPNKVRTVDDLLIEYAIDQGGARAEISGRFWTGSAWGPSVDLDDGTQCGGGPCAVGTINTSVIPAADSDGLGEKQPRTFGEAQIDLRLIFNADDCVSFGSAMLKSRSSDSFTSQLKDFIRPIDIDLQNCGNVIIRKQTDPDEDPNTTLFGYTKSFDTDPVSPNTFQLTDDGVQDYNDTVLFGTGYTVTEDVIPAGWNFVNVDCSASAGVTPQINGATVTFAIDADTDVLDCTYFNEARGTIIVEKITDDGFGSFDFTSGTLTPSAFTLTTTAPGDAGKDAETFGDLSPGTYDVAETVPAGWNLVSATCDDGSSPASIGLSAGETVTCTFHDAREQGAILITKTRKHAAGGSGDQAHPGVTFTITGGNLPAGGATVVTDSSGEACVDGLLLSSFAGDYTVTETVPAGYVADGALAKTVTVTTESTCGDGNEATVSFSNTPLTDLTVSVNSQVDGGTASTIDCDGVTASTGPNGDGSLSRLNLPPGTYNCTIVIDP